jgi:hypothetical protein
MSAVKVASTSTYIKTLTCIKNKEQILENTSSLNRLNNQHVICTLLLQTLFFEKICNITLGARNQQVLLQCDYILEFNFIS